MALHDIARHVSLEGVTPEQIAAINALKDGVHYRVGTCRRYRSCPPDFAEMFIRFGWGRAIYDHYECSDRCIARWIDECGGDELRAKRAAVSGWPYTRRRSRYPTYAEVVAAVLRGEEVLPVPRRVKKPARPDKPLFDLALDRGYRVRRWRSKPNDPYRYHVRDRRDRPVSGIGACGGTTGSYDEVVAWLEPQPPVQW